MRSPAGGRAPAAGRLVPRCLSSEPAPGEVPRVLFQDADLVVVDKPIGWLTHPDEATARPDVFGWLGGGLGVHMRLDVDTSGVLCFSRSPAGARRLTRAFEHGDVRKRYLAVVEGRPPAREGTLTGEVPEARGRSATTRYRVLASHAPTGTTLVEAEPVTGRTHQIRAHFAAAGCPVRGDRRYGSPLDVRAPRLLLHCAGITLGPGAGGIAFEAPTPPELCASEGAAALRRDLAAGSSHTCYRVSDGAGDGTPGWIVDRYGAWLWVQRAEGADEHPLPPARGVYRIDARADRSHGGQPPPALVAGEAAPDPLAVRENDLEYRVVLGPHLSTGLFLDQRPQRAWLRANADGARVLNTFAHAGAFTVAAAAGGAARTVSVDLERDWLARLGPQLVANDLAPDPARHDTIHGDVFDWLRRLGRRGERYDIVVLDPPSTSVGARGRRWSAAQDYGELVALAAPLVAPGGWLWTITNHRGLTPERFGARVSVGLPAGVQLERVSAMPVDFPHAGPPPTKSWLWRFPGGASLTAEAARRA
ncbi:pseudouridine synthase [Myxococcota bacterium]|nr:pseudouridine synthase [Myxococcota bacterium]